MLLTQEVRYLYLQKGDLDEMEISLATPLLLH